MPQSIRNPNLQPQAGVDDIHREQRLRPRTLAEYVGQEQVVNQMKIFIEAARQRNEPIDHVLICGPPGLGKTTLAHIIAIEMGITLHKTSGPVIEKAGDLAAFLTNLEANDAIFIDEIHRLSPAVEEILYPAMEDCQLDIVIGEGPGARSLNLPLNPFTLIGATTRAGLLTSPLRDRFGIAQRLDFYSVDSLTKIASRSAQMLNIKTSQQGAREIATRARGTPRIANRLLRRTRDYVQVVGDGTISGKSASEALDALKVDKIGLDIMDRKLLFCIVEKFDGGPVGIENLSIAINEERETVEELIEPFLIQNGLLVRTARGRCATRHAFKHLGYKNPGDTHPLSR